MQGFACASRDDIYNTDIISMQQYCCCPLADIVHEMHVDGMLCRMDGKIV